MWVWDIEMGHPRGAGRRVTDRREFLKTAAGAMAVPYVITSSTLGAGGRPPASERIVMGGIGLGNQGGSWGTWGPFWAATTSSTSPRATSKQFARAGGTAKINTTGTRTARPTTIFANCWRAGHRRRPHRHARSLARDHHHRGLPPRQGRLLPKTRNTDPARRSADHAAAAGLWAGRFRRQPAGARRLPRVRSPPGLGRRVGDDQVDQRQRGPASRCPATCRRTGARRTGLGHVARPRAVGPLSSLPH